MTNAANKSLFITGAGGFVGMRLLRRVADGHYRKIYCLCRNETPFLTALAAQRPNVAIINADLFQADRYRDALADADIAVHLAAVTGKAAPETHTRVNAEGTAFFVEQCKQADIRGFLHFSTIAVGFEDVSFYPYARAKQVAEKTVEKSGLKYAIVRPTIIFGERSPIWQNFLMMARTPLPFIFGNGRTKIQPIHVDDLVQAVIAILEEERFDNTALALGGREVVTIEDLVRQIRMKITGQPVNRVLHIPLLPLSAAMRALEPLALSLLPFTAGQLTSFSCDGVAGENALMAAMRPRLRSLDKMIADLVQGSENESIRAGLSAEAKRLGQRINGSDPPPFVLEKYVHAHLQGVLAPDNDPGRFDRFVIGAAKIGPLFYLAEAYSSVFHRTGLLRKKMVLLSAIMECMPDSVAEFDESEAGSPLRFLSGLLARSLAFGIAVLISTPIFLPFQVLLKASGQHQVKASWKN